MNNNIKGKSVVSGLIWSFGERITAQLVTFLITILLARILTPEDYGTVSLILVFVTLPTYLFHMDLENHLFKRENSTERDFSTIFWCSFSFSILLYILSFVSSPYIAAFYGNDILSPLTRVLALKIPISSISTIQHAYVSKHMQFKKFFFSTLGGTIISGVVGVIMASNGIWAWAVVFQYLINTAIDTIVLLFTVPWRPHFFFDITSAKRLMSFGWKMTLSSFINSAYGEIRSLIVGKIYSSWRFGTIQERTTGSSIIYYQHQYGGKFCYLSYHIDGK